MALEVRALGFQGFGFRTLVVPAFGFKGLGPWRRLQRSSDFGCKLPGV